jgi:hypothetical protein
MLLCRDLVVVWFKNQAGSRKLAFPTAVRCRRAELLPEDAEARVRATTAVEQG